MKLLSLNVAAPRDIEHDGRIVRTGIFKEPVAGRVRLGEHNLDGDGQADLEAHGGIHKAAYAYPVEHYAYWQDALGREPFPHGQFGENFTVEGMTEDRIHIGDRFRIGGALVEVTQPRVPCYKLGIRMAVKGFEKRFLQSLRTGFYLRTVEPGGVRAGDAVTLVAVDPEKMTVDEIARLLYFDRGNLEDAQRALRIDALSPGWRGSFEDRIKQAGG